jgi:mRNA-degrading endonuclease RelE of RelBE toxin-antitoxin system
MHEKMRAEWKKLTPEQREKIKSDRKAMIDSLTPEERQQMREERKKTFEKMSPEERKKWREDMHKYQHPQDNPAN